MKSCFKVFAVLVVGLMLTSCFDVPPGYVGVKVYMLGEKRGETEVLSPGRYGAGMEFDVVHFPTFTRQYPFTKASNDDGSRDDEAFRFQSRDGVECDVDISIQARVDSELANILYVTYRKSDVKDIIKSNVSKVVRDAFVEFASTMSVDDMYSNGKMELLKKVQEKSRNRFQAIGLVIEEISYMSKIRFPKSIEDAIDAKYGAIQATLQRQFEVEKAKAEGEIKLATAKADAEIAVSKARAEAEANRLRSQSLTPNILEAMKIEKWDGKLPTVSGSAGSIINL